MRLQDGRTVNNRFEISRFAVISQLVKRYNLRFVFTHTCIVQIIIHSGNHLETVQKNSCAFARPMDADEVDDTDDVDCLTELLGVSRTRGDGVT